ncbi:lecithin:cholesterol acyltransferase [Methylobacter tundripaludum]|uniref:Lecithin:cholesterol acyltransferase n=1 Tax=Methylobacter tundripaludum TaxID=173365 RepID=A0A2S6H919_9GAMM|nr:CHAT domain-containing protein [Methylobacter tundripaludum]PPK73906.1 lecithin:cholesterol acyltransferase [Methylobacter tundripaludum]
MNNDQSQNQITLRVDGTLKKEDTTLVQWPAEVYELDGLSRGDAERIVPNTLKPDAVLELELANGTHILVAAGDAERYLGAAARRGDGKPGGIIEVGQILRLSGPRLPAGASRDGLGAWIIKGLRIYREGPSGVTALIAAGTFQDAQLDGRNGLYHCATDTFGLSKVDVVPASAESTLIFIHGTASSTEGSFKDLWTNDKYREQLVKVYGPRIYAFEHSSLTESPIANALDLVKTLPEGARLHLVSHSRGGMVGELLARANRIDLEPFTDTEIDRFLDHAKRLGRNGFEADHKRLGELNRELRKRAIRVERFVRVACPARGTTLASGKLDRWASVMLNLLGKGFDAAGNVIPGMVPVAKGYGLLKHFLLAVVKERTDACILPGLEAMMPDSPLVGLLNAPGVKIEHPLHVLAGDFQGDGLLPWLGDCLSEVFYGGETDLVVNTPSMSGGAIRVQGIRQKPVSGSQVTHFSYFERDDSALALLAALKGDDSPFELLQGPSRAEISRGGIEPKRKANAPIVFLLPGIMGSHILLDENRIWFEPFSMWSGHMAKLKVDSQGASVDPKARPGGWMDRNYEKLARHLADSHEVRPFAYDWRISISDAAERFGHELDQAMKDAEVRGQPLRIVAHSMGGLVARLALKGRWDKFKANPGSRLLQLGTPNQGSHSIAAVLMARDDFVQTIERWFDWKHDMLEFLEIVRDFPGVLELLPWPGNNGKAIDGVDYFDANVWQTWYGQDQDSKKGKSWLPPQQGALDNARAAIAAQRDAELDPECTLYVAGRAPTPIAVRVVEGRVEIGWVDEGDGRVSWKTGIPPGVPVWYTDAVHGDLANHERAFEAYRELIETGDTRQPALSRIPPGARGESAPVFRPRGLEGNALYPSVDEVLAAATGGARPSLRATAKKEAPAIIEVIHGSLASAESPVLIGAYANDSLRGSAKFLDSHLGGQLTRTFKLGRYPGQPHDAMVFLNPAPGGKFGGAIVVGLGSVGDLLPGNLTQTLKNGLLEYVRSHEQCHRADTTESERLAVSALLVGTGFTGLTIEVGARCLLDALRCANDALSRTVTKTRIGRLTLYEEAEDRAIAVVQALRDLASETQFADAVRFDGRLRPGAGGYRGRSIASGGQPGAYRVHIVVGDNGGLRFTVISDRARNEIAAEADQRQAVDGLIASITHVTQDQPGLSRAMFELLVPNGMKEAVADVRTLMMSVDNEAAVYPWEMMRDSDQPDEKPLATRVELVRQLASSHGRGRVPTVTDNRVFVVGDTQSGMIELHGAQDEAKIVARAFLGHGIVPTDLYRANAQQVFEALFYGRYRFMHLAGHGVVKDKDTGLTGMVLGPKTYLTPAQVNKLRHVPEFVFINCCHLGAMKKDAQPRWGELAANLATQFIEMGCKALIAAGWAVNDSAANTFAQVFYTAMFTGKRFGQALLEARAATYEQHPLTNTWGAFQAYGDELYRFPQTEDENTSAREYVHASHLIADLDMHCARLQGASDAEKKNFYLKQIQDIEQAARGPGFQSTSVREKLATAWAELGDMERAIAHYRAALKMEDAGFSLKALEQLANLEIRHGAKLLSAKEVNKHKAGDEYMKKGLERLKLLIKIGPTAERLSLVASHWKRRAQANFARGNPNVIKSCLVDMQAAYWQAAEHTYQLSGEWDYYPLLNALDGAFLSAARDERSEFDARAGQLSSLLQAGTENARRRFAETRDFFHALAEVEADRIDVLWACYDGRDELSITNPDVQNRLIARYCDVLNRMGSVREQDSATNQLKFLIDMLPSDNTPNNIKGALRKLIEGIEKCVTE